MGLRPRGVTDVHLPNPPPLLARRDGAMTTGIHSPPVPPLTPPVVVFMCGLFRLHPIARGGGGGTWLIQKGWFAKKEKIKFAKWCCQWPPVFN